MSILSQSGKIILVREPVCGRFGIHRLIAQLTSGALNVSWDGKSEITMVTFNKKRTLCKILHIDDYGVDCTTRILNTGRFQVILDDCKKLIPIHLTRNETPEIRLKLLFNPKIRQIYDKHRYFYKKSEKILSYTICRHKAVQFINIKDKSPYSKPVLMNFTSILLNLTLY